MLESRVFKLLQKIFLRYALTHIWAININTKPGCGAEYF